ncbi:MAG: 5-bromo-4-chloroindolyl phosphate hydrolysis family protein [Treponema sp.]|jgi:5-bromo-4-chloroindolyl phosphate hydrolysis protein|nr:5-bromo-4-chloroindolyl phosphate hydrolysis family protein [Treponema sp.]
MKKDNWIYIIIPLLISTAVFFIVIMVLQWIITAAAVLAVCCYVGLNFLASPVFKLAGVDIEHIKNSEEIMMLLEEGEKDLVSIKTIIDKSKDGQIKTKAQNVYREGGKIIEYIKKNPAKAVSARRFFNYYLDRANEILTKYHNLISAGIETDRLRLLKEKTLSALESILKGMNLQFSKLISSEVIDIEADVKLLESTIKMEDI